MESVSRSKNILRRSGEESFPPSGRRDPLLEDVGMFAFSPHSASSRLAQGCYCSLAFLHAHRNGFPPGLCKRPWRCARSLTLYASGHVYMSAIVEITRLRLDLRPFSRAGVHQES